MGWLWAVVGGVVATTLLIAHLLDRRGGTGSGMTDRDRQRADRTLREQQNRARPWSDNTSAGS